MRRRFSQVILLSFISLLFISILNTQYIYGIGLNEEAKSYRLKGYEAQEGGDIDTAIIWYQKAINLDVKYAAPHNDLGILFEAKGWLDRAEEEYQKALALDSNYEKAHTNLALLYERKGELEKAAFHWMRRYRLGDPDDPWTYEARQRLEKLGLVDISKKEPLKVKKREQTVKPAEAPVKKEKPGDWSRWGKEKDAEDTKEKPSSAKKPRKKKTLRKVKKEKPGGWFKWGKEKDAEDTKEKPSSAKKPRKKKTKTKPTSKWTRLGYADKKGKSAKVVNTAPRGAALEDELKESLKLAEERLRKEKRGKRPVAETSKKKYSKAKAMSSPGAKEPYRRAQGYFKKGEYARALDTIRSAKKDYPEDLDLLELEQSVKNKMKEERIEDHYSEGIMQYHQEDYSGARKEFEAILNILPE